MTPARRAVRYTCPRCRATHVRMVEARVGAIREVCVKCIGENRPKPGPRIDEHW